MNKKTESVEEFDLAEMLQSKEEIALYLDEAMHSGDAEIIGHALGVAARAYGMTELAKKAGVNRENLYRSLNGSGNPKLDTFLAVLKALEVDLSVQPHRD